MRENNTDVVDDSASNPENTPINIPLTTNDADVDGGALTVQEINTDPANGSAVTSTDVALLRSNNDLCGRFRSMSLFRSSASSSM